MTKLLLSNGNSEDFEILVLDVQNKVLFDKLF